MPWIKRTIYFWSTLAITLASLVFALPAQASYYVTNPSSCPTSLNGQVAPVGQNICGVTSGGVAQFYNTSLINPPVGSSGPNVSGVTLGAGGSAPAGYLLDCEATPLDSGAPYCDNNGSLWCNASSACSGANKQTVCTGGQFGAATCGACTSGFFSCSGGSTVDTSGANCSIHVGGACTDVASGLSGTYSGTCSGGAPVCVVGAVNFQTGVNAKFSTSTPLLQATQYGTGALAELSVNGSTSSVFFVDNNAHVGIGTTTPTSALSVVGDINFTGNLYQNGVLFSGGGGGGDVYLANNQTFTGANIFNATSTFNGLLVLNGGISGLTNLTLTNATTTNLAVTGNANLASTTVSNLTVTGNVSGIAVSQLSGSSTLAYLAKDQTFTGQNNFNSTTVFNANVGIGTTTPPFALSLGNDGSIIATGNTTFSVGQDGPTATYSGAVMPTSTTGDLMVWYARNAAFRAGYVTTDSPDAFDDANMGLASAAFGINNVAGGVGTFAAGYGNVVSSSFGVAFGNGNTVTANADNSYAFGKQNTVNAGGSIAFGDKVTLNGGNSVGFNLGTVPFTVNTSSVMAIMGGAVGVGTTTPDQALTVNGNLHLSGDIICDDGTCGLSGGGGGGDVFLSHNQTFTGANIFNATSTLNGLLVLNGGISGLTNLLLSNVTTTNLAVTGTTNLASTTVSNLTVTGNVSGVAVSQLSGSSTLAYLANSQTFSGQNIFSTTTVFKGNVTIGSSTAPMNLTVNGDASFGGTNSIAGTDSFAVGDQNTASNNYTEAFGLQNTASGLGAFAVGHKNFVSNQLGIALGDTNTSTGINGVAIGVNNIASGTTTFALGVGNVASGNRSLALGNLMSVNGLESFGINVSDTPATLSQANTIALMGGNVGVGTTTPGTALSVVGTTTLQNLVLNGSCTGIGCGGNVFLANNQAFTGLNTFNSTTIFNAGVGIGTTTPGNAFVVNKATNLFSTTTIADNVPLTIGSNNDYNLVNDTSTSTTGLILGYSPLSSSMHGLLIGPQAAIGQGNIGRLAPDPTEGHLVVVSPGSDNFFDIGVSSSTTHFSTGGNYDFSAETTTFDSNIAANDNLSVAGTASLNNIVVTGSVNLPNNSITDSMVTDTLTIGSSGNVNATAIRSGILGNAGVTLSLNSFGSITGLLPTTSIPNNLTISTGTIDNTPIGNTTPSTGIFTNVTTTNFAATGNANLSGAVIFSGPSTTITNLYVPGTVTLPAGGVTLPMLNTNVTNFFLPVGGGTMTGDLSLGGHNITSIGNFTATGTFTNTGTSTLATTTISKLTITGSTSGINLNDITNSSTIVYLTGAQTISGNKTFSGLDTFSNTTTFATTTVASSSITTLNATNLIAGAFRLTTSSNVTSYILTADANGNGTWQAASGTLPGASTSNTIYYSGSGWVADNTIANDGNGVTINKFLNVAASSTLTTTTVSKLLTVTGRTSGINVNDLTGSSTLIFTSGNQTITGNLTIASSTITHLTATSLTANAFRLVTSSPDVTSYVLTADANGNGTWQAVSGTLPGASASNTVYYNGTGWVADNTISNDGNTVHVNAPFTVVGNSTLATTTITRLTVTGATSGINLNDITGSSTIVYTSGNQTIAGNKTFTGTTALTLANITSSTITSLNATTLVANAFRLVTSSPDVTSYVLTADANGFGTWQAVSGTLPGASVSNTLYYNGTGWVADNTIANNGTTVSINAPLKVTGSTNLAGTTVQTLAVTGNNTTFGTITGGTWQATPIGNVYGGTGQNSSGWTGLVKVTGGVWSTTTISTANLTDSSTLAYLAKNNTFSGSNTFSGTTTTISGIARVNVLDVTGGLILPPNTITYSMLNGDVTSSFLSVAGGTMTGDINMGGHNIINVGNLGINTNTPSSALSVNGDINYTGNLYQNGVLVSTGGGSQWTTSGSNIYFTGGNVSIGTTTANAAFNVAGSANFGGNFFPNTISSTDSLDSYAFGDGNSVSGWAADALGNGNIVIGSHDIGTSLAAGFSNTVNSGYTIGAYNSVHNGLAFGVGNTASTTIGSSTVAYSFGTSNIANGNNAFAFGQNMIVNTNNSFGLNVSSTTSTLNQANTIALMGGNVGIGTTTPQNVLAVVGGVNLGNSYSANWVSTTGDDFAIGDGSSVNGVLSGAFGGASILNGFNNFSFGAAASSNIVNGNTDFVVGDAQNVTGTLDYAFGLNINTVASNTFAVNLGGTPVNLNQNNTIALMGANVGIGTTAPGSALTVVGDIHATGNITCDGTCGSSGSGLWMTTGTSTYDTSGNVGIGTTTPRVALALGGDGSIIATGLSTIDDSFNVTTTGADISALGSGTRMVWDAKNASFRAGALTPSGASDWDSSNNGFGSAAFGIDNIVSGGSSLANGILNNVSGDFAFASGHQNDVSGFDAFALGNGLVVSGAESGAFGNNFGVTGNYSFGISLADGDASLPILSQSSTLAIMGGNVGIGTTTPNASLTVIGGVNVGGSWAPNLIDASATDAIVFGNGNNVLQTATPGAMALGLFNTIGQSGVSGGAFGGFNTVSGGFALGDYNFISSTAAGGEIAYAFGNVNTSTGLGSMAFGTGMAVNGDRSFGLNVSSTRAVLNQANTIALMGGNVGIGTTTPGQALTVNGNLELTGNILCDNGDCGFGGGGFSVSSPHTWTAAQTFTTAPVFANSASWESSGGSFGSVSLSDASGTPAESLVQNGHFTTFTDDPNTPDDWTTGTIGANFQMGGPSTGGSSVIYQTSTCATGSSCLENDTINGSGSGDGEISAISQPFVYDPTKQYTADFVFAGSNLISGHDGPGNGACDVFTTAPLSDYINGGGSSPAGLIWAVNSSTPGWEPFGGFNSIGDGLNCAQSTTPSFQDVPWTSTHPTGDAGTTTVYLNVLTINSTNPSDPANFVIDHVDYGSVTSSAANGQFAFTSPDTDHPFVFSGANVGIGTTSPSSALTVVGDIYTTGHIICGDGTCGPTYSGIGTWTAPQTFTSAPLFINSATWATSTSSPAALISFTDPGSGGIINVAANGTFEDTWTGNTPNGWSDPVSIFGGNPIDESGSNVFIRNSTDCPGGGNCIESDMVAPTSPGAITDGDSYVAAISQPFSYVSTTQYDLKIDTKNEVPAPDGNGGEAAPAIFFTNYPLTSTTLLSPPGDLLSWDAQGGAWTSGLNNPIVITSTDNGWHSFDLISHGYLPPTGNAGDTSTVYVNILTLIGASTTPVTDTIYFDNVQYGSQTAPSVGSWEFTSPDGGHPFNFNGADAYFQNSIQVNGNLASEGSLTVNGTTTLNNVIINGSCSGAGCPGGGTQWVTSGSNIYFNAPAATVSIGTSTANGDALFVVGNSTLGGNLFVSSSFGVGINNFPNGLNTAAFGNNNHVNGSNSLAAGDGNTVDGNGSVAFGNNTYISGDNSGAIGEGNNVVSQNSFAAGGGNTVNNQTGFAIGFNNNNTGTSANGSGALGFHNFESGNWGSMAIGNINTSTGVTSIAMGSQMTVSGDQSFGINLSNIPSSLTQANTMAITGGNVGIGTTAPNARLTIEDAGNAQLELVGDGAITSIDYHNSSTPFGSAGWWQAGVGTGSAATSSFSFYSSNGGGNVLTMASDGKVGIGTTTPDEALTVQGNIHVSGNILCDNSDCGLIGFNNPWTTLPPFGEYDRNQVSIGTSNFFAQLTVQPTSSALTGLLVEGNTGQTGPLTLWSDINGINLDEIDANGNLYVGRGNAINATSSLAVGSINTVNGADSVAFGTNNTASATNTFAGGFASGASGAYSFAFGDSEIASGPDGSVAFGAHGGASGQSAVSFGGNSEAEGDFSFVAGQGSTAQGARSFIAGGYGNSTAPTGQYNFVTGYLNSVEQDSSFAAGQYNAVNGVASFALGQNMSVQANSSFGIGLSSTLHSVLNQANAMAIMGGNVGIGTTTPGYMLTVDAGDPNNMGIGVNGYIKATGFITGTSTLDLAEVYPVDQTCQATGTCPAPADAICLSTTTPGTIVQCSSADQTALGIVSTNPGFTLGDASPTTTAKVALAGRVPLKVSNANGPITVGDLLTISNVPGVAVKAIAPGQTIAMALDNFPGTTSTTSTITAFVKLGWSDQVSLSPSTSTAPTGILATITTALEQFGITLKNGFIQVQQVVVGTLTAKQVQTQKLCVDSTCITQDDLRVMLQHNGLSPTAPNSSGGTDSTSGTTTDASTTPTSTDAGNDATASSTTAGDTTTSTVSTDSSSTSTPADPTTDSSSSTTVQSGQATAGDTTDTSSSSSTTSNDSSSTTVPVDTTTSTAGDGGP